MHVQQQKYRDILVFLSVLCVRLLCMPDNVIIVLMLVWKLAVVYSSIRVGVILLNIF